MLLSIREIRCVTIFRTVFSIHRTNFDIPVGKVNFLFLFLYRSERRRENKIVDFNMYKVLPISLPLQSPRFRISTNV